MPAVLRGGVPHDRLTGKEISRMHRSLPSLAAIAMVGLASTASAQSAQNLAKQLANPIASLISVPFQLNYNDGFGPQDGSQTYLNVQPVVPFSLSAHWNAIVRTIVPIIGQDDVLPDSGSQFGLGDTTQTVFLSPKAPGPGGLVWGVGPAFLWPTATDDELGSGKWGAGPSVVALIQQGPWTYGLLANQIWSYAGADDRSDVSSTFLQPFLVYNTPKAVSIALNTETTYNWVAEEWSVPINLQVNKTMKIAQQALQIGGGVRYWADSPDSGPEGWGARLNLTLLFPKG